MGGRPVRETFLPFAARRTLRPSFEAASTLAKEQGCHRGFLRPPRSVTNVTTRTGQVVAEERTFPSREL